jgi:hypothetical protein
MEDSPLEVVFILVAWITIVGASLLVVRLDERRLVRRGREDALEWAWPPASRDSAIVGLGLLLSPLASLFALFFHFTRTRARLAWPPWGILVGLGLGLLAVVVVFAFYAAVVMALAFAFGVDG